DEQTKILRIKEQLEDPHQSDDAVVDLLQTLADMDLTFKGLKETDIGRHVNRLRKHQSSEVRSLVKHLVRKWKELVDEWVGSNNTNNDHQRASSLTDGDSPLLQNVPRKAKNGDQQGPDFDYSPNPHNWSESPSADRINTELEYRPKSVVPKRETSSRPVMQSSSSMAPSASVPQSVNSASYFFAMILYLEGVCYCIFFSAYLLIYKLRPRKEQNIDPDRLASARKRLQENYQEAQN
ncbi:probable mediator of RNA polymerase II transcription subunit 26c, partial [Tanacetum coccineum]